MNRFAERAYTANDGTQRNQGARDGKGTHRPVQSLLTRHVKAWGIAQVHRDRERERRNTERAYTGDLGSACMGARVPAHTQALQRAFTALNRTRVHRT